jgi:hypothetical protein
VKEHDFTTNMKKESWNSEFIWEINTNYTFLLQNKKNEGSVIYFSTLPRDGSWLAHAVVPTNTCSRLRKMIIYKYRNINTKSIHNHRCGVVVRWRTHYLKTWVQNLGRPRLAAAYWFFFKFAHGVTGGSNWLDDVVRPSDVADGGRVTWRYGQPCCLCVGWWRAGHMWPMAAGWLGATASHVVYVLAGGGWPHKVTNKNNCIPRKWKDT